MLSKLQVRNYKSLQNFEARLAKFDVLIGPNNSGKSNIFDCLAFLSELSRARGELQQPITRRGGYESIVFGGDTRREIRIKIESLLLISTEHPYKEGEYKALRSIEYEIAFFNYEIISEKLVIKEPEEQQIKLFTQKYHYESHVPFEEGQLVLFDRSGYKVIKTWDAIEKKHTEYTPQSGISALYLQDLKRFPINTEFIEYLKSWSHYNFLPPRMREAQGPRRSFSLEEDGTNLAQVFHSLYNEYPLLFREMEEILKGAEEEVEYLLTPLTDAGATRIAIKEKYFNKLFGAHQISDGTLKLLGCIGILFSPSPPALICLEEPENFIHPRLLELLSKLLKKASERTQILVSTHSPYFLNFVDLEDLIIIKKEKGSTIREEIKEKEKLKEKMRELGLFLGEIWYSGEIGGVP